MADVQVGCVTIDSTASHHGITHLGGPGGTGWIWTRQQVIDSIDAGSNTFFTLVGNLRAEVRVVNDPRGRYLRSHRDGVPNDNLLALPRCR